MIWDSWLYCNCLTYACALAISVKINLHIHTGYYQEIVLIRSFLLCRISIDVAAYHCSRSYSRGIWASFSPCTRRREHDRLMHHIYKSRTPRALFSRLSYMWLGLYGGYFCLTTLALCDWFCDFYIRYPYAYYQQWSYRDITLCARLLVPYPL